MHSLVRQALLTALATLVFGAWASPGGAVGIPAPCTATALSGTFRVVLGSAGAGHVSYSLKLRNTSKATCFVTGIPGLTLLDAGGHKLPTHQAPAFPGALSAIMVRLGPGQSARATARFSPDVPGPGEQGMGPCEPTATKLRVAPAGGGTLLAPITPATPVCEHGAMLLSVLTAG